MKKLWSLGLFAVLVSTHAAELKKPGSALFNTPKLVGVTIHLSPDAEASLRSNPRKTAAARVLTGAHSFENVGVHLKGGQGSFRPLDDKPALTLNFGRNKSDQRFFGLKKIHLNNSVQDPSYLCEDLAGELFRRAGVPATRVAWAKVELNGRKLGLYVLKEGFTKDFLEAFFEHSHGNLYDGGNSHHEITEALELDCGNGPRDLSDLKALARAAESSLATRWDRLQSVLDVQRFAAFMAAEVLANHIDGYCAMQNNYRVYFDPGSQRAVFLPHGTDRMFYEATAPLLPAMKGMVAAAFTSTPEGKELYQKRLGELAQDVFHPAWMTNRIEQVVQLLKDTEPLVAREAEPLRQRILKRAAFVNAAGK